MLILHCTVMMIFDTFAFYTVDSRVGAALLGFCQCQVSALDHENLQLTQLLDIVQRKLHCALHFNVSEVSMADAGHAATDLSLESQNKEGNVFM